MKNLTFFYALTQFSYWAASTGASSFATTYLLGLGLSSGRVGTFLAVAGVLSCIAQPLLAGGVDRRKNLPLPRLLAGMSLLCAGCFCVQLLPRVPAWLVGIFYMSGIFLSNMMLPLMNALCVSYEQAGYTVNFGVARSCGSAASALSALALGYVIAGLGSRWMLVLLMSFRLLAIALFLSYPAISGQNTAPERFQQQKRKGNFFARYPRFCATLLGISFLGMYHAMTENYMIAILGRLGGDSSHVGTALFLSSMSGAVVIFCSRHIRRRWKDETLLRIAACSFLLKSLLVFFAGTIPAVYGIQLLQMTSYALLEPSQIYYAKQSVGKDDLVTGQAFSTAAYALGCSAGNFVGGQLLPLGVSTMLSAGILMAATGTAILFATVGRKDRLPCP